MKKRKRMDSRLRGNDKKKNFINKRRERLWKMGKQVIRGTLFAYLLFAYSLFAYLPTCLFPICLLAYFPLQGGHFRFSVCQRERFFWRVGLGLDSLAEGQSCWGRFYRDAIYPIDHQA